MTEHTMTVVALEIDWCDTFECDGPAIEDPDEPGTCDECGQPLKRVKVVPASDLRRAVDENKRICNGIRELQRRFEARKPLHTSDFTRVIVGGQ